MNKLKKLCLVMVIGIGFVVPAKADLNERIDLMCTKIKTCSLAELEKQELPPEMKEMMKGMFEGMCATWVKPYGEVLGQAGLEKKAVACIDSFLDASCEELMESENEYQSEACRDFQDAAEAAGVDMSDE